MEYIFEFILELIFDGSISLSKNKKVPKYIRYPLIILIILFFVFVISLIFLTGILLLKNNIIGGIVFIVIGVIMLICSIIKFKKVYLDKCENKKGSIAKVNSSLKK